MKRFLLTLCILAGSSASAWADDDAMAASMPVDSQTILTGMIKSVSWADPAKGTKSEIIVVTPAKKTTNIYVTSTTTLWDSDAKAIMPDKILSKAKVNVIYLTTPEGINIAKSIKILK